VLASAQGDRNSFKRNLDLLSNLFRNVRIFCEPLDFPCPADIAQPPLVIPPVIRSKGESRVYHSHRINKIHLEFCL